MREAVVDAAVEVLETTTEDLERSGRALPGGSKDAFAGFFSRSDIVVQGDLTPVPRVGPPGR